MKRSLIQKTKVAKFPTDPMWDFNITADKIGPHGCMGTIYRHSLTLTVDTSVADDLMPDKGHMVTEAAERAILRELYKEPLRKLQELKHHLYSKDFQGCMKTVQELDIIMTEFTDDH